MKQAIIIRLALVTAALLVIPLAGNHFVEGWNWDLFDFVFAGGLIFGTGLVYALVAGTGGTVAYRMAVSLALLGAFLLVWVNGAVGIIGDGPANLLYFGVIVTLFVGVAVARLRPQGMARALFSTALAQFLVPVFAFFIWHPPFDLGLVQVFMLNTCFAALFAGSGLFFLRARTAAFA